MLCGHEAIKGPAELVSIVKRNEILSPSSHSLFCYHHRCYDAPVIKIKSQPNHTAMRATVMFDSHSRVMLQCDGNKALIMDGS
jgi:hypothetical protein